MSRMIRLENTMINADYIVSVRVMADDELRIKMNDGTVHIASKQYWDTISGYEHIVQVIPCDDPVDVVLENGEKYSSSAGFLCVTADGCIRTLGFGGDSKDPQVQVI